MKILDKLLKVLKTDRNTFFTYILGLCTIFILADRLIEFLLILFTGVATHYWGPIAYAIAYAFPVFTFLFSYSSKYITCDDDKPKWFYAYCIALTILFTTMCTEWMNQFLWMGLISLPGYETIATDFSYLIRPAFSAIAMLLPIHAARYLFKKLYEGVRDSRDMIDSIFDYKGISLSDTSKGWGPYTNEIFVGTDNDHGTSVKIPEIKRFESTLVCGISGSGKTSLIFEPWVAQDINKKFFYRETAKSLAYGALKSGLATLSGPYDNDYINKNFSLNMLAPTEGKKNVFKNYFKNFIYAEEAGNLYFRDLGITYIAPEYETIRRVIELCNNFKMSYNLIDPDDNNSPGLNPFAFDDPVKTALSISTVLKGFYTDRNPEMEMAYKENLSNQIIENLAILLKVAYPKLNNGKLPNIDDMLKLLNNFELVEKLCMILENDPELSKQYENQIGYFKKNFYQNSPNKAEMEKLVALPMSQLDTLLRYPGVKKILCNRNNNINFDKSLAEGQINLVCTRRGDLGENAHKAFGLFFLLLMQFSVLRRPGNENTRLPNYLYIDEFPDFICPAVEPIFTIYRKYRVATVISTQSLAQVRAKGEKLGTTIIGNCGNKIVFGNNAPEENDWWQKEIGDFKRWYPDGTKTYDFSKEAYEDKAKLVYKAMPKYWAGKIQSIKFKNCVYKLKDLSGNNVTGIAKLDFIPSKYKEKQKTKDYAFTKVGRGITEKDSNSKKHLVGMHASTSSSSDADPIRMF